MNTQNKRRQKIRELRRAGWSEGRIKSYLRGWDMVGERPQKKAMKATIALTVILMTGCANTTVTTMVGTKIRDGGFYGPTGPTVTLRLEKPVTDSVLCEYEHVSHLMAGPPFGSKDEEDSLNQVSCGVRFGL